LALSQAAYVHLAASIPNMNLAIDTERTYLAGDIARNPVPLENGAFAVPKDPGLGVEVDIGALEKYTTSVIENAYLDAERPGWFPVKPSY
jgi:L-alanine-DL-glutamate epimerase-like enolase superfamily enzyme